MFLFLNMQTLHSCDIYIYIQLQYVYIIAFVNEQHVYEYRHTCPRLFVVHPRDMVPVDYSGLHNTSSITATVTCEHMHIFIYRQICICMFYAVNIVLRKPFESEMCPVTDTVEHSLQTEICVVFDEHTVRTASCVKLSSTNRCCIQHGAEFEN